MPATSSTKYRGLITLDWSQGRSGWPVVRGLHDGKAVYVNTLLDAWRLDRPKALAYAYSSREGQACIVVVFGGPDYRKVFYLDEQPMCGPAFDPPEAYWPPDPRRRAPASQPNAGGP